MEGSKYEINGDCVKRVVVGKQSYTAAKFEVTKITDELGFRLVTSRNGLIVRGPLTSLVAVECGGEAGAVIDAGSPAS